MEYTLDDRTAMKGALVERLGVKGERMLELPKRWKNNFKIDK
jgi:hypothetical protein